MSASQLEGWVFDPQPLGELLRFLGKSVHLNRPGKKHNSGFGLPPIAVTKINKKKRYSAASDGEENTVSQRLSVNKLTGCDENPRDLYATDC